MGDAFTKLQTDDEGPVFNALFPGCAVFGVRGIYLCDELISFTMCQKTHPAISKISRNRTAPKPTQHTSLPDTTQETGRAVCNATLVVIANILLRNYYVPGTGH